MMNMMTIDYDDDDDDQMLVSYAVRALPASLLSAQGQPTGVRTMMMMLKVVMVMVTIVMFPLHIKGRVS